jgi:hypothetical protein
MKSKFLIPLFLWWMASSVSVLAANSGVIPVSENTYSITNEARSTFNRDTQVLKDAVMQEAEKYCHDQGKQLKVVTWVVQKPAIMTGFLSAKLVFKALAPGDPELTAPPPSLPVQALTTATPGDLYSELLKLDDLKSRGILTQKEFESEKKKLLSRSR